MTLPRRSDLPPPGAHVHLIGVAGAGMRGLGVLLLDAGYRLSGCDQAGAAELDELTERGAVLSAGHAASHVEGADLVIFSSAVPADHPELRAAAEVGVPVMKRARALAALLNERRLAAVSGTHGKTTITALAGLACSAAGLDPIVAVGGRVVDWNGYARPGAGEVAVVEADEYDRSFLDLDPSLLLISSVEPEHLDTYGTLEELERAYLVLAERARARDGVLYCADDAGARRIGESVEGTSYGLAADADCRVEVLAREGSLQRCRLTLAAGGWDFDLEIPGEHNAQNAAGALAMALRLASANSSGVLLEGELLETGALASAFKGFRGVDRRLQLLADTAGLALFDDYAHHPTEVEASLSAVRRAFPERRLVAVFQPHLYSRTRAFADEFGEALGAADEALVLPIYPAREDPLPGVTSRLIADASGGGVRLASKEEALEFALTVRGPIALVFMGAGDVTELAHQAVREITDAMGG
ncbi:MAG: UDP-N-acetylmuramate--L-alanine ligase [Gemmatimonadetes bacterium]|nr:UDP-N-acetylmuramate--L-alanine ligase [Gemmatimonadota bacterium]